MTENSNMYMPVAPAYGYGGGNGGGFGFGDGNIGCETKYFFQCSFVFFKLAKLIVYFLSIICQHLHMIKMYLASIQKRGYAMVLRKYWHDTEKLFLNSNLQVWPLFIHLLS